MNNFLNGVAVGAVICFIVFLTLRPVVVTHTEYKTLLQEKEDCKLQGGELKIKVDGADMSLTGIDCFKQAVPETDLWSTNF